MSEVQRIDLGYVPRPAQLDMHNRARRFTVVVAHRRFGKTEAACMTLMHAALKTRKTASRWGYLAPFLKQAKGVAWDRLKHYARKVNGHKVNESELQIDFPNDSRIRIFGGDNPEALRGLYFDGIVIDEVADLKPDIWSAIIRPALSDRKGWAMFIATPRGMDQLYDLYEYACFGALQPDGSRKKDPEWAGLMYRVDETGLIDAKELESARRTMSEALFRQEYLCDFSAAADNVLITIDVVSDAQQRVYTEADLMGSSRIIGVDVARFGDDRSVIIPRHGLWVGEPEIIAGKDNMYIVQRVIGQITQFRPHAVFIDEGGGQGVIDRLRELGYPGIIGISFGSRDGDPYYVNKRTGMWDRMAKYLSEDGGRLPPNFELKSDLVVPTYSHDGSGRKKLESKDEIKKRRGRSTDCGDALALTFAMPISGTKGEQPAMAAIARQPEMEYKPFARAWGVAPPERGRKGYWSGIGRRER